MMFRVGDGIVVTGIMERVMWCHYLKKYALKQWQNK